MRRIKIETTGTEDVDPRTVRRAKFFAWSLPFTVLLPVGADWLATSGHGDAVATVCVGVGVATFIGVLIAALVLLVRR